MTVYEHVDTKDELLVVLTTGAEDGGRRAALAFGAALAELADGGQATVFLSLESARFGTPSGTAGIQPRGFSDSLDEYIGHFVELGGRLEVCSSCYEEYCRDFPKGVDGRTLLRPNTSVASLATIADRSKRSAVLTF